MAENPSDSAFEVTAVGRDQALDESVDRAPWHSPDVVRSFLAYSLVILGVAIVNESLYEYSGSSSLSEMGGREVRDRGQNHQETWSNPSRL